MDGPGASFSWFVCWFDSAGQCPEERRRNYNCDITYATNSELGFDYLRDNMAADISEVVQREFQYCVIDEVDSILIDNPNSLIISGQVERPQEKYQQAAEVANALPAPLSWAKTASSRR